MFSTSDHSRLCRLFWSAVLLGFVLLGSASAQTLTIDDFPADRWVVQRQKTGPGGAYEGALDLAGTYGGTPTTIEARLVAADTAAALTAWTVVDPAPTGGAWSGRFEALPPGGWYRVEVRFGNDPGVVASTTYRFGVGLILAAIGQSNMVKHFTEDEADGSLPAPFATPHPLSRRLGYGEPPPYLYARPRSADIPVSWGEVTGTGGIRLVNELIAELDIPVLVLDFSLDWTSLEGDWTDTAWIGWTRFAEALALVGPIEAILWHQGAVDAHEEGTLAADYKAGLDTLYQNITNLTGGFGTLPFLISVQNRGVYDDVFYKDESYNQVRRAQLEYIDERSWAFPAGSSIDMPISTQPYSGDGHFWASGYQEMADRYAVALLHASGQAGYTQDLRGGSVVSASVSGNLVQIRIQHDQGSRLWLHSPNAAVEGFTLTDGEWLVEGGSGLVRNELVVTDARLSDNEPGNWVNLTLASPPAGPLRLRYLYGQNVFHAKSTEAERRAGGNILFDDFAYHPDRPGLPINGTTADIVVEPAAALVLNTSGNLNVPEGAAVQLGVHLSTAPTGSVTVSASTFGGDADLSLVGNTSLVFNAGNWQTDQYFQIAAAVDADAVDGQGLLRLVAPGHQSRAVVLRELDAQPYLVIEPGITAFSVYGGAGHLTVRLSRAPASNVVLNVSSGDAARLAVAPAQLTFTPSTWQTPQTVSLSGLGGQAGTVAVLFSVVAASSDDAWDAVTGSSPLELLGTDSQQLVHLVFEESSGTLTTDISGLDHHGVLGVDVLLDQPGVFGRAIKTRAPGGAAGTHADGVLLADFSATDSYSELSAAFWYRLPAGAHDGYLFHWGGTYTKNNAVSAFLDVGTGIRVRVHDGADTSSSLQIVPPGFDDSAWHHLAITKSPQGMVVYFDGVAVVSNAVYGDGPIAPTGGAAIGLNENGQYGVEATFDDFRLWPRRLTAGDVASLYSAGSSASLEVTIEPAAARSAGALWRLDSGPDTGWHSSGQVLNNLPVGTYGLVFSDLADWARPARQEIEIQPGTTTWSGTYAALPAGSPRLHLPLDETSGTVATDISGHQSHGSFGSHVVLAQSGVVAGGARTTAPGGSAGNSADAVTVADLLGGQNLSELSVAFWYRLPAGAHDGYLFSWGGSNNAANHVSAFLDVGANLRVRVHPAGDTSSVIQLIPAGFDNTNWHHLAIVKKTTGTEVYFDGLLAKTSSSGSAAVTPNGLFRLGTNELGTFGCEATFDEVLVFSRAISAAEITQLQSTPSSGQLAVALLPAALPGLGARWRVKSGPDLSWHNSGQSVELPSGVYTVEAEPVAGWQAPADQVVTVLPGATTLLDRTYLSLIVEPILHLALDDNGGSVALDSSGFGRHGIYGARVVKGLGGVVGGAVETAGVGGSNGTLADGIQVPAMATGVTYSEASVSFWYRLPAEPHDGYLFGWGGTNSSTNSISVYLDVGVGLRVRVHGASDSSSVVQLAPTGFENTAWHQIVVIKESAGSQVYFDGEQVYSGTMGSGTLRPTLGLYLGSNQNGVFGVEASFDEVQVFDRALTLAQVAELDGEGGPASAFGGDYLRTTQIHQALYAAETAHPDLVEILDFGDSYVKTQGGMTTPSGELLTGHDLLIAKVGRSGGAPDKPILILAGCLHAREIATPELVLRFLDWLVENDGVDPEATWLLDHHQIYLAPLTNPDGHDLVEIGNLEQHGSHPFRWRKNARPLAGCPWPPTDAGAGSGVDLNRNFPFEWGIADDRAGSVTPCDPYYRGTSAGSEPETQALMSLVSSLLPDRRGPGALDAAPDDTAHLFLQLHSPYRTVAWPWSHSTLPAPNAEGLEQIGQQMASQAGYAAGQVHDVLYQMAGTAENWVYGELGTASFLVEVGDGLMPAYNRIDNKLWPEIRGSLIYAAKIARAPYQLAQGPALTQTVATAGPAGITTTAKAKDAQNDNIVAAEVYLDLPPWIPGAIAYPLDPVDGTFNESEEDLTGGLPAGTASGRHLVFVRARDNQGNWGPVSAAFVDLP